MAARDPFLGRTIGSCRIEALVGEGAFARVYRGRHVGLAQTVAVKVLTKIGAGTAELRFVREAQAAARLTHPNVARVHHLGVDDSYPFIIQEFLEGSALREIVLERGPLELPRALRVARHIARGLIAIHEAGLVHRDIKPANVMVLKDGSAKIVDFGLVGFLDAETDAQLTREGAMLGTPAFLAPEQASTNRGSVGPAADVFALGGVLHFALTGYAPHEGEHGVSLMELISRRLSQPVEDIRLLDPTIPAAVAEGLKLLMAKDPSDRPNAREALKLIRACSVSEPDSEEVPAIADAPPLKKSARQRIASSGRQSTTPRARPTSTRHGAQPKSPAPLLIGVAALAVLGLGAVLIGGRRAPRPQTSDASNATALAKPTGSSPGIDPTPKAARSSPVEPLEPVEPIEPDSAAPSSTPAASPTKAVDPEPKPSPSKAPPKPKPTPTARAAAGAKPDAKPPTPDAKVLPPPAVDADKVDRAVKRAAAWLIQRQDAKGAFPGHHKEYKAGETLLVVRALIKAGVKPGHPAIERALTYALGRTLLKVKSVALGMLALEARYSPVRAAKVRGLTKTIRRRFQRAAPVRDRRWLTRAVPWLIGHQREDGRWGYPKKKDDPGDMHNTAFAILGLKAAARLGVKVDPRVWLRTASYLLDRQEVDGPEAPAFPIPIADRLVRRKSKPSALPAMFRVRGWGYHAAGGKHPNPTQSSTANGLALLAICKSELEGTRPYKKLAVRLDRALRDGAASLSKHGVERRNAHPISTLVSVEQAGTLLGLRTFGPHDWYAIGTTWLLSTQNGLSGAFDDVGLKDKKGSWARPVGATSLAILFLRRATLPLIERPTR